MGSTYIQGFIDEGVSLEQCVTIHLTGNCYPPIHLDFVPTCIKAIAFANDNMWDEVIKMPNGISKTVGEIIEGLHLHNFITGTDEFYEGDDD